jgi:Uma2 family endonuclease
LDDLAREPGKAELIGGRIVRFMPTGRKPNRVAGRIYRSLSDYFDKTGRGEAFTDNMGYAVPPLPSGRQSFCPDASYFNGESASPPMKFIFAAPTLAVEVRSESEYEPAKESERNAKRTDYFEARTPIVWDVDPIDERIDAYHASAPDRPITYRRGDFADAGEVIPDWRLDVAWVFD